MAMPGRKNKKRAAATFTLDPHLVIERNKLTGWRKIGEGGCGEVYAVDHEDWGKLAIKKLGVTMVHDGLNLTSKLKEEAMVLYNLRHKNIIQFTGVLWCPPDFGIAIPLVPLGTLAHFLAQFDVGWLAKVDFMEQITIGMNYLHTLPNPVVHGDLKISNVLVDDGCVMKIADFGLSSWRTYQTTHSKVKAGSGVQGTVTHIPPECWDDPNLRPSLQQDVYAYGIMCWEIFAKKVPFEGCIEQRIIHAVTSGKRPDLADLGSDLPAGVKDIIQKAWAQQPRERPTFLDIKTDVSGITTSQGKNIQRAKARLASVVAEGSDSEGENPQVEKSNTSASAGLQMTVFSPSAMQRLAFPIRKVAEFCIPGYIQAGHGPSGELLVTVDGKTQLRMYKFVDGKYKLAWKAPAPDQLDVSWPKIITQDHIILSGRESDGEKTYIYTKAFEYIRHFEHASREVLFGCGLSNELLLRRPDRDRQKIVVRSSTTFKELRCYDFEDYLDETDSFRMGVHPSGNRYVITALAATAGWMKIYSEEGMELVHVPLGFCTGKPSVSAEYIFLHDTYDQAIHMYDWDGNMLKTVKGSQLSVQPGGKYWGSSPVFDNKFSLTTDYQYPAKCIFYTFEIIS